jgi:hypothetical protein
MEFSAGPMQRSYLEVNRFSQSVSQFSVGDSHEKFVVEEELEVGLWRLKVWFEDFMCAPVQCYLECDSDSSCVKIRCQEADRENFAEE